MKRLQINYTIFDRNNVGRFMNTTLHAIQSANLPLPDFDSMVDYQREMAEYIRDDLGMPNCQVIELEGSQPPEWAVVFSDKIVKSS
jgi:hypothetical protein